MELFLFRHAEYERLYNCTALRIDSVPLEFRQFVAGGIVKCVLCAIYYKHFHDNSCYKLLFFIGTTDFGIFWVLGFFSGWLCLSGAVFCSSPTLMYLVGVAVTSTFGVGAGRGRATTSVGAPGFSSVPASITF
ncbi:hypothetical protein niasHT_028940 [Heterodera trifolii]|uniref:Uncharacterized protein n=1 Tax=Heterodera trifolii TaxID=157864 RepID=A0ABD2KP87_9BILA